MSNTFGTLLKITTFGESHSPWMGVTIDGLESGFEISTEKIEEQLARRRPKSKRIEKDEFIIASGLFDGKTTGCPLTILIPNKEYNSSEYDNIKDLYRPGHADATYMARYGIRDWKGGGRASGRETVCRVAAGSVAMQVLEKRGIKISASILSVGGKEQDFEETINKASLKGESVGGKIRCRVFGMPAGIGEPVFDKLDALISHAVMSIGAVKGIEFGSGFSSEFLLGSENNEEEYAGGILGGISDGNDIEFTVAVKPTPSVSVPQMMKNSEGKIQLAEIHGRHDTCICLRIGPVIEAMTALVILDCLYLKEAR